MIVNRSSTTLLFAAALCTAALGGSSVQTGFHPYELLASLLPLQLAAVFWCLTIAAKGAESRLEGQRLQAND